MPGTSVPFEYWVGRQPAQRSLLIFQFRWITHTRRRFGQRFNRRLGIVERDHRFRLLKAHIRFSDAADL